MKKITTVLGASHSEFEKQLKDILNEISETIEILARDQLLMTEYQNKLFLKQHAEVLQTSVCELCSHKAAFTTINIAEGTYKSYCNKCLSQTELKK